MRIAFALMLFALAVAQPATAQVPNAWRNLDAGPQVVGWGDLVAEGMIVQGRRFIMSKTPQSSFMGDVSWMAIDFTLNCRDNLFTAREGQYLALDGTPVGKMNARPTEAIEAGTLEDLIRITICEGRPLAGGSAHATREAAMDAARALAIVAKPQ